MDSAIPIPGTLTASSDARGQLRGQSDSASFALVTVRDGRVYDILDRQPFVRSIMTDGIRAARTVFGAACRIATEVYEDPSAEGDLQIFVMIRTSSSVDEARSLLERFDDEWWLNHISSARGLLAFALEYE